MSTAVTGYKLRNPYCNSHAYLFFMSPCCVQGVDSRDVEHFVVRGSMHQSIILIENPTRCNSVFYQILFLICMKLNMFWVIHLPSSGA